MNANNQAKHAEGQLFGPTVRYADGRTVRGKPLDVDQILGQFEQSDSESRSSFLCIIAHDLTVAVRCIVFDPPVTETGIESVRWINESLHRLTSCVNPRHRWSASDEVTLIRGIIENSFRYGFEGHIGRALAAAAGNALGKKNPVAAK